MLRKNIPGGGSVSHPNKPFDSQDSTRLILSSCLKKNRLIKNSSCKIKDAVAPRYGSRYELKNI